MKKEWLNSIVIRFLAGFMAVILATLTAFAFVYHQAYNV